MKIVQRIMLIAAGALATGCARDAILELELELPPATASARYAFVQARSDQSFAETWIGDDPLDGFMLAATCSRSDPAPPCNERTLDDRCSVVVSVVASGDAIARPLDVRVHFCEDVRCGGSMDSTAPEHRVVIERAFYVGQYTRARTCVDEVPAVTNPTPERIDRCDVRCREGSAAMYCRLDGTHFCEPPAM